MGAWTGAIAAAIALGGGLAGYAWWESTQAEATRRTVIVPGLPPGLEGLRVLHVSDTHFPANGASLERFGALVSELEYDIVFATGDYVETAAGLGRGGGGVFAAARAVRGLRDDGRARLSGVGCDARRVVRGGARGDCWAVGGDWLTWPRSRSVWKPWACGCCATAGSRRRSGARRCGSPGRAMTPWGWRVWSGRCRRTDEGGGLTVLLTHSADALLRLEAPPPLVFSATRTAARFGCPGTGAPVRHSKLVTRKQAAGVFERAGSQVVVSQGFGTAVVPLRFLCRPEVCVVELRAARV